MEMNQHSIESKGWHKLVARPAALLAAQNVVLSYLHGPFKEMLAITNEFTVFKYLNNSAYVKNHEFYTFVNEIKDKVQNNPSYIQFVIKQNYQQFDKLLKTVEIIPKKLKDKSNTELKLLFNKYVQQFRDLGPLWIVPFAVEKICRDNILAELKKRIKNNNINDYLLILTTPTKLSYSGREQQELIQLAVKIKRAGYALDDPSLKLKLSKHKHLWQEINQHLLNYSWLNIQFMLGDGWKVDDLMARLQHIINPEEKLVNLSSKRENTAQQFQALKKKLNLSKQTIEMIDAVREYAFLRTYRKDISTLADYRIRPLLEEIAWRFGLSYKEITYYLAEEIEALIDSSSKVDKKVLHARIRDFIIVADKEKLKVLSGKQLMEYKNEQQPSKLDKVKEVRGVVANRPITMLTGVVKIVKHPDDLLKVTIGDIMISPMTTPNFTPAMERAAAFITDEGGILCHAAIVSREMNKPCIISTKFATRVFRDGDLIELDLENGVVKKLG